MNRLLAVDWGTKRVGLAVSDPGRSLARALPTLAVRGFRDTLKRLEEIAVREGIGEILVGLPLLLSGEEGDSARRARKLARALEVRGYRVTLRDERWTSEAARDLLRDQGVRRPRPGRLDAVAAVLLLQEYLDESPSKGADA